MYKSILLAFAAVTLVFFKVESTEKVNEAALEVQEINDAMGSASNKDLDQNFSKIKTTPEEVGRAELYERNRDQRDFNPYDYPEDYQPDNTNSRYYPYEGTGPDNNPQGMQRR